MRTPEEQVKEPENRRGMGGKGRSRGSWKERSKGGGRRSRGFDISQFSFLWQNVSGHSIFWNTEKSVSIVKHLAFYL